MSEAFFHFATIGWKLLFAIVPPSNYAGGWAAFIVALSLIGVVTAVVGEVATILGCVMGIPPSVTAITFVAMGTSLPDTFASMTAAKTSKYADSAIGNVTGSNSVNVFLGLGLPWVIAAHYNANLDQAYLTPAGPLGTSVFLFLCTSVTCFIVLIIKRCVSTFYLSYYFIGNRRRTWRTQSIEVHFCMHLFRALVHLHHFLDSFNELSD